MCLTAHNLPVELVVMKKTGSSVIKMAFLRLAMMVVAGLVFNAVLPKAPEAEPPATVVVVDEAARPTEAGIASPEASGASGGMAAAYVRPPVLEALKAWGLSTLELLVKMVVLIVLIMILQKLLEETGAMNALSKLSSPFLGAFGLPRGTSVLWLVIQIVGYSYGAAVLMDQVQEGKLTPGDSDLLNHHAALCHSLLEDTALFVAIGVPILWITLPRLAMAIAIVWMERARRWLFRKSFEVGTI
jgi:spore maturation protein SpmB